MKRVPMSLICSRAGVFRYCTETLYLAIVSS